MACFAMLAVVGCGSSNEDNKNTAPKPLAAPMLSVTDVTDSGFTVVWNEVANAESYTVMLKSDVQSVTDTRVEFSDLSAGMYNVQVKAVAAADSNYLDSDYASIKVTVGSIEDSKNPWVGRWQVTSHETISFDNNGNATMGQVNSEFYVTIMPDAATPNELVLNGFSIQGEGWFVRALQDGNTLYIMNGEIIGEHKETGYDYVWLAYCSIDGKLGQFFDSEIPSYVLTMDDSGNVSCEMFADNATFNDGITRRVEVVHTEIYAQNPSTGDIYFLNELPVTYRAGVMDWVRAE